MLPVHSSGVGHVHIMLRIDVHGLSRTSKSITVDEFDMKREKASKRSIQPMQA